MLRDIETCLLYMSPAEVIKKRRRERERQGVMAGRHYRERETDREGGFGTEQEPE